MNKKTVQLFVARIIANLDNQIREARSDSERNVLFARKAFALARHSQIPEARELIKELRQINSDYRDPKLSAWVMFAEGVIEYSDSLDLTKSKDRIFRAHLVSQVVNDPTLAGTSAAWLAYFTLTEGKFPESRAYLEKAFAWTTSTDFEARSRACMTFGMAFYYAGELERARYWFQKARNHAVTSGDIAMQNIILFNSAAFQAAALSLLDCAAEVDPKELQFAVMSMQSAGNLNEALGISNQPSMVPVLRAELMVIEKRWDEAIALFDEHINNSVEQGQARWAAKFYAQRAWCKAKISKLEECKQDLKMALYESAQPSDPDDLAILNFRIASCASMLNDSTLQQFHLAMAEKCLDKLREQQSLVRDQFGPLADSLIEK